MEDLYCGFSQVDITPDDPKTVYLDGYGYRVTPAEGVRDKIYAKACYIRSGREVFVIISLDACGLNSELNRKIRRYVRIFTGLKDANFVFCASHTHAAPVCGVLADLPVNYQYWNFVGDKIVAAVKEAEASARRGELRFAYGTPIISAYNRRGQENNIDKRVHACGFFDEKGILKGVLASASCHATCVQSYNISADYISVLFSRAAEKYPNVPFMFLQGRGADVEPLITENRRAESVREAMLGKLGNEFADGVFAAVGKMKSGGVCGGELVRGMQTVSVPLIYPEKKQLDKTRDFHKAEYLRLCELYDGQDDDGAKRVNLVEMLWCDKISEKAEKDIFSSVSAEVQLFGIKGKAAFAFVPFELLTETGNSVEKILTDAGIPPENCFVIGHCNGVNGYLPPSSESGKDDYETKSSAHWYGLDGEYDSRAEELILLSISEMSKKLL